MNIKRGEIYYIDYVPVIGQEQRAGRPAVIVGDTEIANMSGTVMVVYLTIKPQYDSCAHITVRSTGKQSTALCEQIAAVSLNRLGKLCGTCTPAEMEQIDIALVNALGLESIYGAEIERIKPSGSEAPGFVPPVYLSEKALSRPSDPSSPYGEEYDELLDRLDNLEEENKSLNAALEQNEEKLIRAEERAKVYAEQNSDLLAVISMALKGYKEDSDVSAD